MNRSSKLKSLAALASVLVVSGAITSAPNAWAQTECLLDTNNDGVVSAGDTDGGANAAATTSTACGTNTKALVANSTAVGQNADATDTRASAYGRDANANAANSTAIGAESDINSTAAGGIALGQDANVGANSVDGIVIGNEADVSADSPYAIAVGGDADANQNGARARGAHSIAIGSEARTGDDTTTPETAAPGAIAIGGDIDGDGKGAVASAAGAIAIGADVVADVANTMVVGVPVRVERSDGTTQVRVHEKSAGNNVRTMFNLICETCTPAYRFQQVSPSSQVWFFRMLQSGSFSVDDPATMKKEAEFRSGGNLVIGGALTQNSDRGNKQHIDTVDSAKVLAAVASLPILKWEYKGDDGVKHLGPMAQDFYSAFGLGDTPKGISSIDTGGVALAAIQGLNQSLQQAVKEKDIEIAAHKSKIDHLEKRFAELEAGQKRLAELEKMLRSLAGEADVALH